MGFPAAGLDVDRPLRREERQPPRGGSEVGRWGPQQEARQVAPVAVGAISRPRRHRVQDVGEERQVAAGDPAPEARRGEADLIQECQDAPGAGPTSELGGEVGHAAEVGLRREDDLRPLQARAVLPRPITARSAGAPAAKLDPPQRGHAGLLEVSPRPVQIAAALPGPGPEVHNFQSARRGSDPGAVPPGRGGWGTMATTRS